MTGICKWQECFLVLEWVMSVSLYPIATVVQYVGICLNLIDWYLTDRFIDPIQKRRAKSSGSKPCFPDRSTAFQTKASEACMFWVSSLRSCLSVYVLLKGENEPQLTPSVTNKDVTSVNIWMWSWWDAILRTIPSCTLIGGSTELAFWRRGRKRQLWTPASQAEMCMWIECGSGKGLVKMASELGEFCLRSAVPWQDFFTVACPGEHITLLLHCLHPHWFSSPSPSTLRQCK